MKLVNIGFGNYVSADRILSVLSPDSAPIKRVMQDAKESGSLIDSSFGRSTKSVLVMDNGCIILSSLTTESISEKINTTGDNL